MPWSVWKCLDPLSWTDDIIIDIPIFPGLDPAGPYWVASQAMEAIPDLAREILRCRWLGNLRGNRYIWKVHIWQDIEINHNLFENGGPVPSQPSLSMWSTATGAVRCSNSLLMESRYSYLVFMWKDKQKGLHFKSIPAQCTVCWRIKISFEFSSALELCKSWAT